MHSVGIKSIEMVGKLMDLKNDVNYGKTYIQLL